jgi:hypothetical protein
LFIVRSSIGPRCQSGSWRKKSMTAIPSSSIPRSLSKTRGHGPIPPHVRLWNHHALRREVKSSGAQLARTSPCRGPTHRRHRVLRTAMAGTSTLHHDRTSPQWIPFAHRRRNPVSAQESEFRAYIRRKDMSARLNRVRWQDLKRRPNQRPRAFRRADVAPGTDIEQDKEPVADECSQASAFGR